MTLDFRQEGLLKSSESKGLNCMKERPFTPQCWEKGAASKMETASECDMIFI